MVKKIENKEKDKGIKNSYEKIKSRLKKLDYYKILKHGSIASVFLFLFFIILSKHNYLPLYWNLTYFFYFTVLIITLFLVQKIKKIPENQRDKSGMIYIFSYLFLLTLIIFTVNQFLKRQIIMDFMPHLTALSIMFGFLTFYSYRNRVEKDIEKEKIDEEKAEQKRAKEFDKKFPKLAFFNFSYHIKDNWRNKNYLQSVLRALISPFIWIARLPDNFVKWMYKEGWGFSIPLVTITTIFIIIKIAIPLIYTGSYIDEYYHILSGIEFFKTGHFAEMYYNQPYIRGALISFLVGLFMYFLGETILIAKMIPAIIGIINFFLLLNISKKMINKKMVLLLLIIYTIIPWFIFNHFFIRMYILYEFFFLILTFCFILILNKIRNKKKLMKDIILLIIILSILNFFSNDSGKYMILLYSSFFFIYIFLFEISKTEVKNNVYRFISKNIIIKLVILMGMFIIFIFALDGTSLIGKFFSGSIVLFSSSLDYKYNNLFFNQNIFFSLLFLISITFLFIKKIENIKKIIILSSFLLFWIHYFSSLDLQMTRVIIYFLPMFYLISLFSFSGFLSIFNKNYQRIILFIILFMSIFSNYPQDFLRNGPYLPTEVDYCDYEKASLSVMNKISEKTVIITNFPHIYDFYAKEERNKVFLIRDKEKSFFDDKLKYVDQEGTERYSLSNDPIITDSIMLLNIIDKNQVILLIDPIFYEGWTTEDSKKIIDERFKKLEELKRIEIYIEK